MTGTGSPPEGIPPFARRGQEASFDGGSDFG